MTKASSIVEELSSKKKLDISLLQEEDLNVEYMSSGCAALDWILGGGFPIGRITEIYGDTSTGKSLIAAQAIAMAQQEGHIALMADTESAVSLPIMKAVGVNTDDLIYCTPDTVEEVFEIFENAIETKAKKYPDNVLLLVWDSIAATSVGTEMEADYGKAIMASHAKMISQAMRKITRLISKDRICALFLNQTRQKIGIMFGDTEATFGGKAVGFHASVRVRLKLAQKLKKGKKIVAIETRATVVKNKVATPFRSATLPIFFGHGIDDSLASLAWLEEYEFIKKSGSWKTIELNGQEIRFQKPGWSEVYEQYYEDIVNMIIDYDDNEEGELTNESAED